MVYAVSYKWLAKSIGFLKFFLLLPFWTKIAFFKQIIVILSPILSSVTIGCRAHCVTLTFNSFHSFIYSLYLLCVQYSFEWHKVHQNKTKPIEAFYNLHGTSIQIYSVQRGTTHQIQIGYYVDESTLSSSLSLFRSLARHIHICIQLVTLSVISFIYLLTWVASHFVCLLPLFQFRQPERSVFCSFVCVGTIKMAFICWQSKFTFHSQLTANKLYIQCSFM